MQHILNEGTRAGVHDSTIGNKFRSSIPAAEAHGYTYPSIEYEAFAMGYFMTKHPHVTTDAEGFVINGYGR